MSNETNSKTDIELIEEAVMGGQETSELVYSTELSDETGASTEGQLNDFQEKLKEVVEHQEVAEEEPAGETKELVKVRVNLNRVAGGLTGTLAAALITRSYGAVVTGVVATAVSSTSLEGEPSEDGAIYNTGVGFAAGLTTGLLGGALTNYLTGSNESAEA